MRNSLPCNRYHYWLSPVLYQVYEIQPGAAFLCHPQLFPSLPPPLCLFSQNTLVPGATTNPKPIFSSSRLCSTLYLFTWIQDNVLLSQQPTVPKPNPFLSSRLCSAFHLIFTWIQENVLLSQQRTVFSAETVMMRSFTSSTRQCRTFDTCPSPLARTSMVYGFQKMTSRPMPAETTNRWLFLFPCRFVSFRFDSIRFDSDSHDKRW